MGVNFELGRYDKSLDKVTVGVRGQLEASFVPHTFAQGYVNGTGSRTTQVRVVCATKNEHTLLAVEEPAMHQYVLLFSSPLGCELSCAYTRAVAASAGGGDGGKEKEVEV